MGTNQQKEGGTPRMNDHNRVYSDSANSEITLVSIARLLISKIYWLMIAGLICGALVFLVLKVFVSPKYESRVSFYVYNSTEIISHSGTINNSDLQAAESLATTYSKILESNSVLDAVLEDLEDAITRKELSEMVSVAVVTDTQLIEVVIKNSSPEFACKVAGSFAKVAPTEIVRVTKAGGVEVVDRPEIATEKSSPRTLFDTAIGIVIGVLIASFVVIIRTLADTTIYLPEDIPNNTGLVILGQIPEIDARENSGLQWKLKKGGSSSSEEAEQQS